MGPKSREIVTFFLLKSEKFNLKNVLEHAVQNEGNISMEN